ncbi:hypothetical protein [Erythrobacter oryzae]|uniref:hypothetical protein n=1 Tax=Erythrobacter oryzae TaxID=3019556 RepID=UPI002552A260|nr:hypothetical protein [Erythrobacter sp. COR-2]
MTDKRPPAARPSRSAVRPVARIKRKIAKQATSAVAYELVPPAPDDPLLDFVPVPHVQPRANSITPDVQRAFIAQLAATGIVQQAARHVGKSLEALYKLRQRPGAEGFRAAWDAALDRGVARLEDSALARAIQGEERPILHGGKVVGTERRHNDALVMFFLRNRLPHRYDQQKDVGPGHPLYEKVAAAYAAEQRRIAADPVAEKKRLDTLHHMVARWYKGFTALWEERLVLMGIDIHDPAFVARAEQLKAEGRWPEEHPEVFGIRVGLLDDPADQPAR